MKESIFKHSLRAFFVSLFSICGLVVGLILAILAAASLLKSSDEDTFSSNVKLMPDQHFSRKELPKEAPILLQINIDGTIGKDDLKASKIQTLLLKSREEDFKENRVKGILLVINSPGGDAIDSDIIYRLLKSYKERYQVPIYAYIDGICASGSYYLACAADQILASPVSLIGSIGVISWPPFLNVTDLLQKIGVDTKTLSAGLEKDQMNPFRPWKPNEDKNHQDLLNFFYHRFVDVVCENRTSLSREKLVEDYGAKVFSPTIAKEYGYIDQEGVTRECALIALAKAAGLKEDEKYQVVLIESKDWFKKLFSDYSFIKIEMPGWKPGNSLQYLYE